MRKTSERVIPEQYRSKAELLIYLRHLFAYKHAYKAIKKNTTVLDLGCGEGYGTKLLSEKVNIIGVDVDKSTIVEASNKYKSPNCAFRHYNGKVLPFNKDYFDSIISFQTVEHIENDRRFISEIFRVLKHGGCLFLTTPNKAFRLKPGQAPFNKYHIREYNEKELRLLLKSKFTNVKMFGIKGNREIQKAEHKRIKKINTLVSLDFLKIRSRLPEPAIRFLKQIAGLTENKKEAKEYPSYSFSSVNTSSYYTTKQVTQQSLDLLVICIK